MSNTQSVYHFKKIRIIAGRINMDVIPSTTNDVVWFDPPRTDDGSEKINTAVAYRQGSTYE